MQKFEDGTCIQPSHPAPATAQKMQNEHDQGNDQDDVDESASKVQGKSTAPKNQKDNCDDEKHVLESGLPWRMAANTRKR